jgi:hypothetical protein
VASETIQDRFVRFHDRNPDVYWALLDLANQAYDAGRTMIGMKQLFEVLRWNRMIAGLPDELEEYKLCNDYTSRYARLLMYHNDHLSGIFATRELRAP